MKRIIFSLVFLALIFAGRSQDLNMDMSFYIRSQTGTEESPGWVFWGAANYYREKHLPPYFPISVLTNYLSVNLAFSTPPVDVWIVEKQADDSLVPVCQITNIINEPDYGCYGWRELTLTTNQIHSLVFSNWYVVADFGDSNFVANLEPIHLFVHGPTAKIVTPPVYEMWTVPYYRALSLNNRDAVVTFDGSPSTDPYYLPIEFSWTVWDGVLIDAPLLFTNSQVSFTRTLKVGSYLVRLDASDEITAGMPLVFGLDVKTAGQEVNTILSNLQNVVLPPKEKQLLIRVMSLAAVQFDRGHMKTGCDLLGVFQKLVKKAQLYTASNDYYVNSTQFIIDAFKKSSR